MGMTFHPTKNFFIILMNYLIDSRIYQRDNDNKARKVQELSISK